MRTIMTVNRPKHKPTRRTPRPEAPFGAGVLASHPFAGRMPYDAADLEWAAQAFAGEPDYPDMPDAAYDALAQERAWEEAYEAGLSMGDRCSLCGLAGPVGADRLCDGCSGVSDPGWDVERCAACGRPGDTDAGLCDACETRATEMSWSGNRGR